MKRLKWPVEDIKAPGVVCDLELVYMYWKLIDESIRLDMAAAEYFTKSFWFYASCGIFAPMILEDIVNVKVLQHDARTVRQMAALIARRVNVLTSEVPSD